MKNSPTTKYSRHLEALYLITEKMHTLELDYVLNSILQVVTTHIGFDRARLYLYDASQNNLSCKMSAGMQLEVFEEINIPIDSNKSIVAKCFTEKKPYVIKNAAEEPGIHQGLVKLFTLKSFVSVPLIGKLDVKGVISADYFYSKRDIETNCIESLEIFANQAALAIENAEIHEQLKNLNLQLEEKINLTTSKLKIAQQKILEKERIAAFGEMAAGLTHEIRNPLTSIKLLLENLLLSNDMDASEKEDLLIIQKETQRLNNLMGQLLNLAKGPNKKAEEIDLKEIISASIDLILPSCKKANINLTSNLSSFEKCIIKGNSDQLKQIFCNLCLNSIEAMPQGGPIEIFIEESDDCYVISITDSGTGISKRHHEKIFLPFFTTKNTGTGLGLATVKKIIYEHKGNISFTSKEGQGTTMTLTFNKKFKKLC